MRVFLSYAQHDAEPARQLAEALRSRGFEAWVDVESIEFGQQWSKILEKAIDEADACLVLVSRASDPSSPGLSREWSTIQKRRWQKPDFRVYPVQLGDAVLPPFLRKQQAIRISDPGDRAATTVAAGNIAALLNEPATPAADLGSTREASAPTMRFNKLERMLEELKASDRAAADHNG